ncbi:hypothetical protein chiPu_0031713 [Chiloscyllium punctatum]|uniref:Uncharacterized protein n=1 Tax=Chiloscyllium punctatum TaxID=137246 RepID=A0A401TXJ9_CHIPU|nr:hypothetical protein [Chiloscyllium punctatum]
MAELSADGPEARSREQPSLQRLSVWERGPEPTAPLTHTQSRSVSELGEAADSTPLPAQVSARARGRGRGRGRGRREARARGGTPGPALP